VKDLEAGERMVGEEFVPPRDGSNTEKKKVCAGKKNKA
jgi:hypothetical protein